MAKLDAELDAAYLEDSPDDRDLFSIKMGNGFNLRWKFLTSLIDFHSFVRRCRSKVYVIDGNFPRFPNSDIKEFLAPEAITIIRTYDPCQPIIVYSDDMRAENLAIQDRSLIYMPKDSNASALIEKICRIIDSPHQYNLPRAAPDLFYSSCALPKNIKLMSV